MTLERLFVVILVANLLGFGGLGSLPVLRGELVGTVPSTNALLLRALAVGNISPGPNGLFIVATGYFLLGLPGAGVAVAGMLLPPMLVFVLDRIRQRLIRHARFRSTMASLSVAVVALLAASSMSLVRQAAHSPLDIAMVVLGVIVLLSGGSPLLAVGAAVAVGFAFSFM
jgi:chromate transporter